jgi:hypothetical protein
MKLKELPLPEVILEKEMHCPIDDYPIELKVYHGYATGKNVGWASGQCINCGLFIYGIIDMNKLPKK